MQPKASSSAPDAPLDDSGDTQAIIEADALAFYAEPTNEQYLAREPSARSLADIICRARGVTGHNLEYLFRLVDAIRATFPDAALDDHLLELERACHEQLSTLASCRRQQQQPPVNRKQVNDEYVMYCIQERL